MKPSRIQLRRTKGWRLPPNTVSVARPHAWGNPFVVGRDGDAAACVQRFREWLLPYQHGGPFTDFLQAEVNIRTVQKILRGKNLACWCAPGAPCHADVLLEIANEYPDLDQELGSPPSRQPVSRA